MYSATFEYDKPPDGTISFQRVEGNQHQKVRDIEIDDLEANCEENRVLLNFTIYNKTPVLDNRKFGVFSKDPEGRGKAIVEGRFSKSFRSAKGTARLYGSYRLTGGNGWYKCESGTQNFKATMSG